MNPLQVLRGEMLRRKLRPADEAAGRIGGGVGGPGDGEQIEHGDGAERGIAAQEDERRRWQRGISEPGERPDRMA